jgi:hypothetical protein
MNPQERLDLKKLMQQPGHDYEDNTDGIRKLRHSTLIHSDIMELEKLKKEQKEMKEKNPKLFVVQCQTKCSFLYNSYTDIFNRVLNDELDLAMMGKALQTLKDIEDGKINQQEGSVLMGKLFYQIFVDSALKKGEKLEKQAEETDDLKPIYREEKPISYKDFKKSK